VDSQSQLRRVLCIAVGSPIRSHFSVVPLPYSNPDYGAASELKVNDTNRLIHFMIAEDYLEEFGVMSSNVQHPTDMHFIQLGSRVKVNSATRVAIVHAE
jgi:hypothetical protein